MTKSDKAILAACGEYYVSAYLSGNHLIAALPRAGVPGCDLLVTAEKRGPAIRVQVKTGGTASKKKDTKEGWIFLWWSDFSAIENDDKNLWYAYVYLNDWPRGDTQPEVFFVPSDVVVRTLKKCKADDEMAFFWMKEGEALQYKGKNGLQAILNALGQTTANA
jgi:hypothetical protein